MPDAQNSSWEYIHFSKKFNEEEDEIITKIKALHAKGQNLSQIKDHIDSIEADAYGSIVRDLRAVASLAKRSIKPGKQFVLAVWDKDKVEMIQGIDFAHGENIAKDKTEQEIRVLLKNNIVVSTMWHTTTELTNNLKMRKIPWHLAYLDD